MASSFTIKIQFGLLLRIGLGAGEFIAHDNAVEATDSVNGLSHGLTSVACLFGVLLCATGRCDGCLERDASGCVAAHLEARGRCHRP
eukprot:8923003-Lingulodinium_polyedra.AAC.1